MPQRSKDPFAWFPGRGLDAVIGRQEIAGSCLSGEEIGEVDYRALVIKAAHSIARQSGRTTPSSVDLAKAQRQVDSEINKRDITRNFRW
ncbi:MAG: hypothetical protein PHQ12_13600 [Chthoniobacteraceae bacterium]|nr:hypothetical protein [Chthoniobacteraceae bacterium]